MPAQTASPKIVFEDAHLIVLSKPAGMLSQGAQKGVPSVVDWLRGYLGRHYVGLVHRLDRNVSGLLVAAKRSKAAARLTASLQAGEITRTYRAWLVGRLKTVRHWRHYLVKNEMQNRVRVVSKSHPDAKEAVLSVRPIGYGNWEGRSLTLAEFELETGRSHQIRAQAAFAGYPVLGDPKYGERGEKMFHRPALHASRIRFPHPMSGQVLEFRDEFPPDMKKIKVS